MTMLELTNLCKTYKEFSLGPVDLKLEAGTAHGLIGANGAGKSTMFRCIMGVVRRDQGLIKVNGNYADQSSGGWKQSIGYVGDYTAFYDHLPAAKNLQMLSAYYENWSNEVVQTLASRFDLNLSQQVKNYSTGQRTKLAIICALAHKPPLLLLDEPSIGLDPVSRDLLMEILFEEMQKEDLTLLYSTHHVSEIEQLADRLIVIDQGRILRHEDKEHLAANWRKITFRYDGELGEIPNQVSVKIQGTEFEVISNNCQSTIWYLEKLGAESVQSNRISTEQICVQILKHQVRRTS
ncbi:MAG: hypothetical protein COA96_06970 [SAR86 cluster bacterium]|uniref:ABC transporter domain-containing protein n=1 Tax=SAR86 cluster bacterium TaxID=2030880 RepID=A0A2A5B1W6_9GAMM|nr:MAG: hypothetical protein COA96_06970 [SAR86 cluster bacterium]